MGLIQGLNLPSRVLGSAQRTYKGLGTLSGQLYHTGAGRRQRAIERLRARRGTRRRGDRGKQKPSTTGFHDYVPCHDTSTVVATALLLRTASASYHRFLKTVCVIDAFVSAFVFATLLYN